MADARLACTVISVGTCTNGEVASIVVKSKLCYSKMVFYHNFTLCVCVIKNETQSVVYGKLVLVVQYHPGWPYYSPHFKPQTCQFCSGEKQK